MNFGTDENSSIREDVRAEASQGHEVATVPEGGAVAVSEAPQAHEQMAAPTRPLAEVSEGSEAYGWAVAQIKGDWGDGALAELETMPGVVSAHGAITAAARFGMKHSEIAERLSLSGFGNHPTFIWAAMQLERMYGQPVGPRGRPMNEDNRSTMNTASQEIDAVRDRLADLQARQPWKTKEIAELYQKEMALLSLRDGDEPIVGGNGRAA